MFFSAEIFVLLTLSRDNASRKSPKMALLGQIKEFEFGFLTLAKQCLTNSDKWQVQYENLFHLKKSFSQAESSEARFLDFNFST